MPFKNPHPLYVTWNSMRQRCGNPRYKQWVDYGGRGISVCDRWNSFAAFINDMGPRPTGHVLDRTDNDGNYEPSNCRWATRTVNQRNQRVTRWVTIGGVPYKAADLADVSGVKTDTIIERASAGLPMGEILSRRRRVFQEGLERGGKANGERLSARTHCKNGHPWNEENTRQGKRQRECRACAREKAARMREEKRR